MELPPPPAGKRRPEGADLSRAAWRSVARLGHQAPRGFWGRLCCCVEGRRGPEEPGSPPAPGTWACHSSGSNESPRCPVPDVGPEDLVLLVLAALGWQVRLARTGLPGMGCWLSGPGEWSGECRVTLYMAPYLLSLALWARLPGWTPGVPWRGLGVLQPAVGPGTTAVSSGGCLSNVWVVWPQNEGAL